jgi:antitoxin ParD1/3/4
VCNLDKKSVTVDLRFLPKIGNFEQNRIIMRNTSISLGEYFDQFVKTQVSVGRYKNVSEVIRAGLRLLENEESKVIALKNAILDGLNSPRVENFDFDANLKKLKAEKRKNG